MENVETVPVPAAAPANAATDPNATAAPGETKPEAAPEKTLTQTEVNELVEKRLAKERRKREDERREKEYWRNAAMQRGAEKPDSQPKAEAKPADDGRPKRESFDTYEDFLRADARWEAKQEVDTRFTKQREEDTQNRNKAEQQKLEKQFREHATKVGKEIQDFDEVMEASEAPMTRDMADAMLLAGEIGPRIAYHLAKNPEEAERIAALPGPRQAAEIGKLEAKLSTPQAEPKTPSKAPAPIKPLGGREIASDDEPDPKDNSPAGSKRWADWRQRQIKAKRKGP